jgi:hypothetical protein
MGRKLYNNVLKRTLQTSNVKIENGVRDIYSGFQQSYKDWSEPKYLRKSEIVQRLPR